MPLGTDGKASNSSLSRTSPLGPKEDTEEMETQEVGRWEAEYCGRMEGCKRVGDGGVRGNGGTLCGERWTSSSWTGRDVLELLSFLCQRRSANDVARARPFLPIFHERVELRIELASELSVSCRGDGGVATSTESSEDISEHTLSRGYAPGIAPALSLRGSSDGK